MNAGNTEIFIDIKNEAPSTLDSNLLYKIVEFVAPPLKKSVEIFFYVSEEDSWDGSCFCEELYAEIVVPAAIEYPVVWNVNSELEGFYQNGCILDNLDELLVWLAAHELCHFYFDQFRAQRNRGNKYKLLNTRSPLLQSVQFDEEAECDLYAMLRLNQWRRAARV